MSKRQLYCYLFEAKSIQGYLFHSGKLKDVISASERLDRLIDSGLDDYGNTISSVLSHVVSAANLTSDIHLDYSNDTTPEEEASIRFLRCKGGAFYCYSSEKKAVQRLRSLWTLTLNQLFPSLEYIDALTEADSLQDGIDEAFKELAASRNKPQVKLPLALTIFERCQRTGKSSVPLTSQAIRATSKEDSSLDIDVEKHRQAYQTLEMRDNSSLQKKYTPPEIDIDYPLNFDTQFPFQSDKTLKELSTEQKEAIKDIALIHIDGNGMGLLLMALKEKLQVLSDEEYLKGFRTFSDALEKATVRAARSATLKLYETVARELGETPQDKITLPMRPIVLGGDDVTLYCRADLALNYAKQFCSEFKKESQIALEPVFRNYFDESDNNLHPYITASGGILYQKAGHPFTQSHDLVELLTHKAKQLTKSIYGTDDKTKVGPAALALYRISNATQTALEDLVENAHIHTMNSGEIIQLGQNAYFVENEKIDGKQTHHQSLPTLEKLRDQSDISIKRWRKIATFLAQGDLQEAIRIFDRAGALAKKEERDRGEQSPSVELLKVLAKQANDFEHFYWPTDSSRGYQTIISDLLIIDHYKPLDFKVQDKELVDA